MDVRPPYFGCWRDSVVHALVDLDLGSCQGQPRRVDEIIARWLRARFEGTEGLENATNANVTVVLSAKLAEARKRFRITYIMTPSSQDQC
jgi:hypothetical protein